MVIQIPDLLTAAQVSEARAALDAAEWVDGRATAGPIAAKAKSNLQVPEYHPAAQRVGQMILEALGKNPLFIACALPLRVLPPMFNRYGPGQAYGTHVDNSIRQVPGTPHRIRADLSATLFLTDPQDYDGGELCVDDPTDAARSSCRRATW